MIERSKLRIIYLFISMKDKKNTTQERDIKFCHSCANIVQNLAQQIYKRSVLIFVLSLFFLSLTFLAYLGLYTNLSKLVMAAETVTVSSEGPAAETAWDNTIL